MRIKEILSQNRRDFRALFICPFCGHEEENRDTMTLIFIRM